MAETSVVPWRIWRCRQGSISMIPNTSPALRSLRCLASAVIAFSSLAPAVEIKPPSEEMATEYGLDAGFYKKTSEIQNILIATSERVSDVTHREAAALFDHIMRGIQKDVAQRIRDHKVLCIIAAHNELTSDIPQFKSDKTGRELDFYNWRQRGFLTRIDERIVVFFSEEDVMEYEGGMQLESILIHEFGHVIDFAGLDEEQRLRLTRLYESAREQKLWNDGRAALRFRRVKGDEPVKLLDALARSFPEKPRDFLASCLEGGDILVNGKPVNQAVEVTGNDEVLIVFGGEKECYAAKNRAEYFAEGVQSWFSTNRTMDHDHNHIHTREQLKAYDPGLAEFLAEILGDGEWRFISPRERAGEDHLAGYDPAEAPVVVDADFIQNAALDYYDEYWAPYWKRLEEKHRAAAASE
jgi:hypothetical protein